MADRLAATMEAVRRAVEGPRLRVLRAFLAWWRDGLSIDLPPRAGRLLFGDRRLVHVSVRGEALEVRVLASATAMPGEAPPVWVIGTGEPADPPQHLLRIGRRRPVILQLLAESVLAKRQEIPRAAAAALDQAVGYGLSQWTPFEAEEVHWTAAVVSTSATHALCEIRLVPRAAVEPLLTRLREAGLPADGLQLGPGRRHLRLVEERKHARARRWRRLDLGIAAMAAVLIAANAGAAWRNAAAENAALSEGLRAQVEHRREEDRLDEAIRAIVAREQRILGRRTEAVPLTEMLAAIARSLPPEAEISELAWDPARVRVVVVAPAGGVFRPEVDAGSGLATERLRTLSDLLDGRQQHEWILATQEGSR